MKQRYDEGSVLILVLGLVVLAALFVTIVIDVSTLYLERRSLIAAADGAALAGAQAVNKESLYRQGLPSSGPLPLDAPEATAAARAYLTNSGVDREFQDLTVVIDTTSNTIEVQLSARVQLPITNTVTPGGHSGVDVVAAAVARTPVMSG